jgi:hypothetical protein
MKAAVDASQELVPQAKPSPYAKRWRMTDLTKF